MMAVTRSGSRSRRVVVPVAATVTLVMLGASLTTCGGGGEASPVTVFTPETGRELAVARQVLTEFGEDHGIAIEVEGTRDFESLIESQIAAGDPPDIGLYAQPGTVRGLAAEDELAAISEANEDLVRANADPTLAELVTTDGGESGPDDDEILAIPVKADLKSLVWYSPGVFAEHGYDVPDTFEGFGDLVQQMAADGNPAFCVGLRSGDSSGWPLTDWVEDFLLRVEDPEVYDQWVAHEIPFDDPRVVAAAEMVVGLWRQDGVVFGGPEAAVVTDFGDAALPVLDGECMMVRGANFQGVSWPAGTTFGPDGDVDAFVLPGSAEHPNVALTGGQFAAPFDDRPEVRQVLDYLASPEYAEDVVRIAYRGDDPLARAGSFLAAAETLPLSHYPEGLSRDIAQARRSAGPVRFDASDRMPRIVGSGTFWSAAIDVTLGTESVATAFAEVEASWPDG